ncbi:hypothetical protein OIU85_010475 [Salix viminalis]|uniref:F-box domain-containing protein n=1 Tax=Salix viminalis TaxID=40686 RepID=A0A9Q0SGV6_SALVM|nr:hypothetical protein OIU85_010475 [Salix viminalis]
MIESLKTLRKTGRSRIEKEFSLHDSEVPDILLTEIFLGLVSKRWLYLISDPFFARSNAARIKVIAHDPPILLPTSFNPMGFSELSSLSLLPVETEDSVLCLCILASSNGLVLCGRIENPLTYSACNPLAKQHVIPPKPPIFSDAMNAEFWYYLPR